MKKLTLIIVFNQTKDKILMCYRSKEPYKNKYNFVGGKVEENEDPLTCAYRELEEETGITNRDINLIHLMDFKYYLSDIELMVYVGKLNKEVTLIEEKNSLHWFSRNENFYDLEKYAGEGNCGHMLAQVFYYEDDLLK